MEQKENMLNRIESLLEAKDWEGAAKICDRILDVDFTDPDGNYYKFLTRIRAKSIEEYADRAEINDEVTAVMKSTEYALALKYGTELQKDMIHGAVGIHESKSTRQQSKREWDEEKTETDYLKAEYEANKNRFNLVVKKSKTSFVAGIVQLVGFIMIPIGGLLSMVVSSIGIVIFVVCFLISCFSLRSAFAYQEMEKEVKEVAFLLWMPFINLIIIASKRKKWQKMCDKLFQESEETLKQHENKLVNFQKDEDADIIIEELMRGQLECAIEATKNPEEYRYNVAITDMEAEGRLLYGMAVCTGMSWSGDYNSVGEIKQAMRDKMNKKELFILKHANKEKAEGTQKILTKYSIKSEIQG